MDKINVFLAANSLLAVTVAFIVGVLCGRRSLPRQESSSTHLRTSDLAKIDTKANDEEEWND